MYSYAIGNIDEWELYVSIGNHKHIVLIPCIFVNSDDPYLLKLLMAFYSQLQHLKFWFNYYSTSCRVYYFISICPVSFKDVTLL